MWLDVAVDDLAAVRVGERLARLLGDIERHLHRQRPAFADQLLDLLALDVLQDDVVRPVFFTGVVDGDYVGVNERGGGPRFPLEAGEELVILRVLPVQNLNGDVAT